MNEPLVADQKKSCPICGAMLVEPGDKCWLCFSSLSHGRTSNPYAAPPAEITSRKAPGSTLLLVLTLAAVCLVLMAIAPGLGILAAIIVAPAIIRTAILMQRRANRGRPVGWFHRVAAFLGSLAVLIVLVTVGTVGALGTFCLIAVGSMSVPQMDEELALWVAALAGIVVAVGFILLFIKLTVVQFLDD